MWLLQFPHHEFVAMCGRIAFANTDAMMIGQNSEQNRFSTLCTSSFLFSHVTASLCHRERLCHVCAPRLTPQPLKDRENKVTRKRLNRIFRILPCVFRRELLSLLLVDGCGTAKKGSDSSIQISCYKGPLEITTKKHTVGIFFYC